MPPHTLLFRFKSFISNWIKSDLQLLLLLQRYLGTQTNYYTTKENGEVVSSYLCDYPLPAHNGLTIDEELGWLRFCQTGLVPQAFDRRLILKAGAWVMRDLEHANSLVKLNINQDALDNFWYFVSFMCNRRSIVQIILPLWIIGLSSSIRSKDKVKNYPQNLRVRWKKTHIWLFSLLIKTSMALYFSSCISLILKTFFRADRPFWYAQKLVRQFYRTCEPGGGSPSGHTGGTSAFLHFLIFELWSSSNAEYRPGIWFIWVVEFICVLTAVSRVYTGSHFIYQTIFGWCLGAIVALLVSQMFKWFDNFFSTKRRGIRYFWTSITLGVSTMFLTMQFTQRFLVRKFSSNGLDYTMKKAVQSCIYDLHVPQDSLELWENAIYLLSIGMFVDFVSYYHYNRLSRNTSYSILSLESGDKLNGDVTSTSIYNHHVPILRMRFPFSSVLIRSLFIRSTATYKVKFLGHTLISMVLVFGVVQPLLYWVTSFLPDEYMVMNGLSLLLAFAITLY